MSEPAPEIRLYETREAARWDELVEASSNGTLLHTRRFLAHHGARFVDRSLMISGAGGRLVGVLPVAEDPLVSGAVVSHPGSTYGGLVYVKALRGQACVRALERAAMTLADLGYECLRYKVTPWIYHRRVASDDVYALFRLGATRSRCELTATIDLASPGRASHGRRSGAKTAQQAGVEVAARWDDLHEFWPMLEANLADRFDARPTHSVEEVERLRAGFGDRLQLVTGRIQEEIVAGVLLFEAGAALHCQYIASNEIGRRASALDPVLSSAIALGLERRCRFFDFGTSTEPGSDGLNSALYDFKVSFGAGTVAQEQYELRLPLR